MISFWTSSAAAAGRSFRRQRPAPADAIPVLSAPPGAQGETRSRDHAGPDAGTEIDIIPPAKTVTGPLLDELTAGPRMWPHAAILLGTYRRAMAFGPAPLRGLDRKL